MRTVVGTWPFSDAAVSGAGKELVLGTPLVAALVKGVNVVEDDPVTGPYFVGRGGTPNAAGEYEFDAAVMRGSDCRVGAVASLQGFSCPVSVAHSVMLHSPHSLLSGAGARDFALKHGFIEEDVSTAESRAAYEAYVAQQSRLPSHDTLSVIGADGQGHVAAAVSTSGMAFKARGRIGDSPIPGAGYYADDMGGAAAATGEGDRIIQFAPAFQVVQLLKQGVAPQAACEQVLSSIAARLTAAGQQMFSVALVAVNVAGDVGGVGSFQTWTDHVTGKSYDGFPYVVWRDGATTLHIARGVATTTAEAFPGVARPAAHDP
eukprot:m.38744 g.38744  ORF g.38744 m.38744 type:complete len:318 (-) comp5524_c0_seq4:152-1105(-)